MSPRRSHQPLSCKDGKPGGVGLEAEVVLTGRVSCEGEFAEFTVAFGHLNLESKNDTVRTTFHRLLVKNMDIRFHLKGLNGQTNQPVHVLVYHNTCLLAPDFMIYLMIWVSDCQCDAEVRGAGGLLQIPRLQQEIP